MFLVIPHSNSLSFSKFPLISYFIVLVCIVIFYFQYQSESNFKTNASSFCQALQAENNLDGMDKMVADQYLCELMLKRIEERPDLDTKAILHEYFWFKDHTSQEIDSMTVYIEQHYRHYSSNYPGHINKELMYFPESVNPLKMLVSSLSHADIFHLAGNIIFFMAFAPAIEVLLASGWLYAMSCLLIIFLTSIAYTVSVIIFGDAMPTLGLSGLVMGMMGMFAALMPYQKIKVFIWFLLFIRNISVPAWVLAACYIGLDSLNLILGTGDPSINLVSHVSGGITGYLLGYALLKTGLVRTISP